MQQPGKKRVLQFYFGYGYNFLDFFKAIKVMVAIISHAKNKVIKISKFLI